MTASRIFVDESSGLPVDFVERVERIEIGMETAAYLLVVIDLFARLLSQRGHSLPTRLAAIRGSLTQCVDSRGASGCTAGQAVSSRVGASPDDAAALDVSHLEAGIVDTATAAELLGIKEDTVRFLCRRKRLAAMKPVDRWWIAVESLDEYRASRSGA